MAKMDYRAADWTDALDQFLAIYDAGLNAYLAADWAPAGRHFEEALRLVAEDKASRLMLEKCQRYSVSPPAHWDGVSH
jgi:adenylate cyclase